MARPSGRPIRNELIESAMHLIQRVGVNGFSYGDLAKELGIKAPSIHHHFPSKEDLVAAVAAEYRQQFKAHVDAIADGPSLDRIRAYGRLFSETAKADRLCLGGVVSAEWLSVGDKPRREVNDFFSEQQAWIEAQLRTGVDNGEFDIAMPAHNLATTILAALEGSMLMTRAGGDSDLPADAGDVIASLIGGPVTAP